MEKANNVVRFEGEDGEAIDMVILKEFEHKDKKYAVLMGVDDCDCEDGCDCGCHQEKDCDDDCACHEEKDCEDDCDCEESICIVEELKDKDGNDIFRPIEDEKLYNVLVDEADKILFEEN